ncbi:uncharacterized protein TRIADDRAFT_23507 [Trichoplax adhaerens]|uniref:DUF4704 domain-containing protein n=1 Tax=Trichoplax adhaerens TaxID=10228 RepID=B3RVQ6_TRIAD|nr:hypothetical protein TRIADDRAFT_23507 [Trichoplax adhaerens]EDV25542.1 hypothetical protein TRIADDRAFT_23507 [Trichoplax adhaerens]|eukprot:XP_002111575.1 hypothetical protein TRIADDRAFT_23507 [Trichoplax adhaerens]
MHLVRKLVGRVRSNSDLENQRSRSGSDPSTDDSNSLMNLRKLYVDYCQVPDPSDSGRSLQELKLYKMLPLFCQLFGNAQPSDMFERFGDILPFTKHVSRLFVSEIRRRVSNHASEEASSAIIEYLETTDQSVRSGWNLLKTIQLLSAGNSAIVASLVATSLPSTMVKCMYLFYDLPSPCKSDELTSNRPIETTPSTTTLSTQQQQRRQLQIMYGKILSRLCQFIGPIEELVRKDDLALLMSAVTTWCPNYNKPWRNIASSCIRTISSSKLSTMVLDYIHNKNCISVCVNSMRKLKDVPPLEMVEMFVTIFCCLKDTSNATQTLLDDFRTCNGYLFVTEFLLKVESQLNSISDQSEKQLTEEALRNMILLIASMVLYGYMILKASGPLDISPYQEKDFVIPQPTSKGNVSVRNIAAFQVLQTVFIRANSTFLSNTILDSIINIYNSEAANYFILSPQKTIANFIEKMSSKSISVQEKILQLLEYVACNLNFVPQYELCDLAIALQAYSEPNACIFIMRSMIKLVSYNSKYQDIYREVKLLDGLIVLLKKYAMLMRENECEDNNNDNNINNLSNLDSLEDYAFMLMETLRVVLEGNTINVNHFRRDGGARCVHNLVPYSRSRAKSLRLVQQLILSEGGEDDLGTLLGMMNSAPQTAVELKIDIMNTLARVFSLDPSMRSSFREVGGFIYIVSVLVSMNGSLSSKPFQAWETVDQKQILGLLKMCLRTLTLAMRDSPANKRFFTSEVSFDSLADTLQLLGCFNNNTCLESYCNQPTDLSAETTDSSNEISHDKPAVSDSDKEISFPSLIAAERVITCVFSMALDLFDWNEKLIISRSYNEVTQPPSNTPLLVNPGALCVIINLLPCVGKEDETLLLQKRITNRINRIIQVEYNQQTACDAGLINKLLTKCQEALSDDCHPLHLLLQTFEHLAAQAIQPNELREFLRLGAPLHCYTWPVRNYEDIVNLQKSPNETDEDDLNNTEVITTTEADSSGAISNLSANHGSVSIKIVKSLVSMTTQRDIRFQGASLMPQFIEFDMNSDGFGCLCLLSIAPQTIVAGFVTDENDSALAQGLTGGVGNGERLFPPQNGLTYATWLCVDIFSSPTIDAHPIRLLTVGRCTNTNGNLSNSSIPLSISISPFERTLIVSTVENYAGNSQEADSGSSFIGNHEACFKCDHLLKENVWRHIVVILNKGVIKNSTVSLFIDGMLISTQKLHYVQIGSGSNTTSSNNANNSAVSNYYFARIGTPPSQRRLSKLKFRLGPTHLFEEPLSTSSVTTLYLLGPNYIGNFQAPMLEPTMCAVAKERGLTLPVLQPIVSEERIMFSIYGHALTTMTFTSIAHQFAKSDARAIAKELGLQRQDSSLPISFIVNSACHLSGPARSPGAVVVSSAGTRVFCPMPVAQALQCIGGVKAILGLVSMAMTMEELYAAVKVLVSVVSCNGLAAREMERIKGYQILAMLFKHKSHLINSHILHLIYTLVGTVDSSRESSALPCLPAFVDLLCDLEIWNLAPGDLQLMLFEHFYELLTQNSNASFNITLMRKLGMVSKLIQVLRNESVRYEIGESIVNIITLLLSGAPSSADLLRLGQYLISTLPPVSPSSEKLLSFNDKSSDTDTNDVEEYKDNPVIKKIKLRNLLLEALYSLSIGNSKDVNHQMTDAIVKVLGFDWLATFLHGANHKSTVILALRMLIIILQSSNTTLSNSTYLTVYKEGTFNGGWLSNTEHILNNTINTVACGVSVNTANLKGSRQLEINKDFFNLPGFVMFQNIAMHMHIDEPEIYYMLIALLLGKRLMQSSMENIKEFDLSTLFNVFDLAKVSLNENRVSQKSTTTYVQCPNVAVVLLSITRRMVNQFQMEETATLRHYPVTIIQFLFFLYCHIPEFAQYCSSQEFLEALAATLFPLTPQYKSLSIDEWQIIASDGDSHDFQHDTPHSPTTAFDGWTRLCSHPAKRYVLEFIRDIIADGMISDKQNKLPVAIEFALEAAPSQSPNRLQADYQTEVICLMMNYLISSDALGDRSSLVKAAGNYSRVSNNVLLYCAKVVDKLWQGMFTQNNTRIFDFLIRMIEQARQCPHSVQIEQLYHCLNRCILYQLSRLQLKNVNKAQILDTLKLIMSYNKLILSPSNNDHEFLACLCHHLLSLSGNSVPHAMTDFDSSNSSVSSSLQKLVSGKGTENKDDMLNNEAIISTSKRLWDILLSNKSEILEEIFKTTLAKKKQANNEKLSIAAQAAKHWNVYHASEQRGEASVMITQQAVSLKSKRVISRLSNTVRRIKKDPKIISAHILNQVSQWIMNHKAVVSTLIDVNYREYKQECQHLLQYVSEEWNQLCYELIRERGIWGPLSGTFLDKWKLDATEGPCRMRKRMIRNEDFYKHYPYVMDGISDDKYNEKFRIARSYDSMEFYRLFPEENISPELYVNSTLNTVTINKDMEATKSEPLERTTSCGDETNEQEDNDQDRDHQSVLRFLEVGDKITAMFRCARIEGLDNSEGVLLFGREHFYVVDGFTLLASKEIKDISSLTPGSYDPVVPRSSSKSTQRRLKRCCLKWFYGDVHEVYKRRYLLQPTGIEFFCNDGRNSLLVFPKSSRDKVYSKLISIIPSNAGSATESLSGMKRNIDLESSVGLLNTLMGERSVTQRWERGEISNFQYLMHINTLAGRSYNDLMQYPVLPWIIADYVNEEIDLTNSKSFRDLSKPMGAQGEERVKKFMKRYNEWDDPTGETPPYHYGTHYSSAMIVASYLIRLEPFTQHFLRLQGGHFDLPDRMFHSIQDSWNSASQTNMADVKELIPEFFTLPTFLMNNNHFDLGEKQNGTKLGEVILPPWAKNSAYQFIRINREALESDYVSANLHKWIDLIFGYKQQGQMAIDSINVYHHLFYEGAVDISTIRDPLKRNAIIAFINNFGQIPQQIFKKPHPAKRMRIPDTLPSITTPGSSTYSPFSANNDKLFYHALDSLVPSSHPLKELKGAVGQIVQTERSIYAVERNKVLIPSNYNRCMAWGFSDFSFRILTLEGDKLLAVYECVHYGQTLCICCPHDRIFITGGTSTAVCVWKPEVNKDKSKQLKLKEILYGHTKAVTDIVASLAYSVIVSGSEDRTCIIWDLNRLQYIKQLPVRKAPVTAIAINDMTGDITTCAGSWIHVWTINGELLTAFNASIISNSNVLCCAVSDLRDWDKDNVIVTGSADGKIRVSFRWHI